MAANDAVDEARRLLAAPNAYTLRQQVRDLLKTLADEVERWRTQAERESTCVVCSALLLEAEEPPHCLDCYVTDEDRERWEEENSHAARGEGRGDNQRHF